MKKLIILVLSIFLMGNIGIAQDIISAKDAGKLVTDKNTVFLSARKASDYAKVHITGAVNIDPKSLVAAQSMLIPASDIAKVLGSNGISNKTSIIVYDNGSGKFSGRMYWILKYMGAKDVKVLDGGMKAWRMARKPVTKNPTSLAATTFTPQVNKGTLATMSQVKNAINNPSYVIVDARTVEEFNGTADSRLRKGHIPSAVNLDHKSVLTAKSTLKSNDELIALFKANGITKDKKVILYCESSVRAGILYLALKGLGYPNVQVYDGAYLEWQGVAANDVVL